MVAVHVRSGLVIVLACHGDDKVRVTRRCSIMGDLVDIGSIKGRIKVCIADPRMRQIRLWVEVYELVDVEKVSWASRLDRARPGYMYKLEDASRSAKLSCAC